MFDIIYVLLGVALLTKGILPKAIITWADWYDATDIPKQEEEALPKEVQTKKQGAQELLQVRADSQTSLLSLVFADHA